MTAGPLDVSDEKVVRRLVELLAARGESLAVAESLTGGRLAAAVTGIPGASAVFLGGVVSYATEVKTSVLGVGADVVTRHGVVSGECAEQMAAGVRRLLGSTWALATTGVAGPARQEGKPAGTVFLGLSGPAGSASRTVLLGGSRAEIQAETCRRAVDYLIDVLV